MVNPAPVRVVRKSTMNSPLVKAANKIVTSPTFAKARSIDFDKKNGNLAIRLSFSNEHSIIKEGMILLKNWINKNY